MTDMESLDRAVEEARWERMEESPDYVVWRKRWAEGYSESSAVPKAIEAAIRAPLEAEVERLREALRGARESAESVEVWLRPLLCDDDVTICSHPICNAWIAAGLTASNLRALATHPSSTEGTKEVEG